MTVRSSRSRIAPQDLILARLANHRLFRAMLAHQGIDPARACRDREEKIFGALRMCAACTAPESCCSWLAENHPRGTYPGFCLNGAVMESCRIDLVEPHPSASGEPALEGILADLMIQQFAAPERARPFNPASRKSGILAELDELAGELL
jgi:hypothetical protein